MVNMSLIIGKFLHSLVHSHQANSGHVWQSSSFGSCGSFSQSPTKRFEGACESRKIACEPSQTNPQYSTSELSLASSILFCCNMQTDNLARYLSTTPSRFDLKSIFTLVFHTTLRTSKHRCPKHFFSHRPIIVLQYHIDIPLLQDK